MSSSSIMPTSKLPLFAMKMSHAPDKNHVPGSLRGKYHREGLGWRLLNGCSVGQTIGRRNKNIRLIWCWLSEIIVFLDVVRMKSDVENSWKLIPKNIFFTQKRARLRPVTLKKTWRAFSLLKLPGEIANAIFRITLFHPSVRARIAKLYGKICHKLRRHLNHGVCDLHERKISWVTVRRISR